MQGNWNTKQIDAKVKGIVDKKLNLVGHFLLGVSRALTPVGVGGGSGRLKGATDFSVSKGVLRIGNNVNYARYVEFDTKPHIIKPKDKKALFWKGATHPIKAVHHPGTKAQPFLRPLIKDYDVQIMEILSK